jgi:hypothetical protein
MFLRSTLLLLLCTVQAAGQDRIGLLVEPLNGQGTLGRKTSTLLHLQIWQTLRAAPPGNSRNVNFGRGIVYWDERFSPPKNHAEAEALGGPDIHFVLWGNAEAYGGGVVVQAYLTVATPRSPNNPGTKIWRIPLPELKPDEAISVDIPAWRYEFAPIVLSSKVIPELNTPEGIPMYDRTFSRRVGALAPDFRAWQQGPDVAEVESGGVRGWVRLPGLSANRSEVTDFCGAVIRMYRKDWSGAIDLFRRVVTNPRAPVNVKISSYLMMACAAFHSGRRDGSKETGLEFVEAAWKLNPYLQETVRYKCMALLAGRMHAPGSAGSAALDKLSATVKTNEYLFPHDDRWLGKVKSVLAAAGR